MEMEEEALAAAKADKKMARRLWSMGLFMAILAVPIFIAAWRFWGIRRAVTAAEKEAVAEMAKTAPNPVVFGILGSIRLDQGRLTEALPLLKKAAELELASKADSQDNLTLAKAQISGAKKGIPGASKEGALAALRSALQLAEGLAPGKRAATWFSAGLFYQDLGEKALAVQALEKAVTLQPDDWVDQGGGRRYKSRGLAAYYQKMLAGAVMD